MSTPVETEREVLRDRTLLRREGLAGLTTFLAMAYILFVNPQILGDAGVPEDAVFVATALAAAVGSIVMGVWARLPIALAPGMGLNAFFAYTVVLGMGVPWETALAGTLVSGVLFLILALTGVREAVINAIPLNAKLAVGAGIGLFIAFIGAKNAGIIVADEANYVGMGDLSAAGPLVAVLGVIVTSVLLVLGLRAAVFAGLAITAVVAVVVGVAPVPDAIVGSVPSLAPTFGVAFGSLGELLTPSLAVVVFTMLFVDLFDTSGTLMAVTNQAGLLTEDGKIPRAGRALGSDSVATIAGSIVGTSTTTSYIESSAGIGTGGKTGITAVTTGLLFLLALPFSPLLATITAEVTAPALIVVGVMMARSLGQIEWGRYEEAIPAFAIVLVIPLAFSIAKGIAVGLFLVPLMMLAAGRWREVSPILWVLAVLFVIYFGWLA